MRYYNCFYICGNTVLGGNNVFEEVKGERLWGIYSYSNFYRDYRYLQDEYLNELVDNELGLF